MFIDLLCDLQEKSGKFYKHHPGFQPRGRDDLKIKEAEAEPYSDTEATSSTRWAELPCCSRTITHISKSSAALVNIQI